MKKENREIMDENVFDHILDDDEQIIKIIKPSKGTYWKAVLLPWCAIPLFWPHIIFFMVIFLFTPPFLYARAYKRLFYAYTNKRLIVRSGAIGIDYRSLDYKDITGISVDVGFIDKGSKTGTIRFQSPSMSITFSHVPDPYNLMKEIKGYINTVNKEQNPA